MRTPLARTGMQQVAVCTNQQGWHKGIHPVGGQGALPERKRIDRSAERSVAAATGGRTLLAWNKSSRRKRSGGPAPLEVAPMGDVSPEMMCDPARDDVARDDVTLQWRPIVWADTFTSQRRYQSPLIGLPLHPGPRGWERAVIRGTNTKESAVHATPPIRENNSPCPGRIMQGRIRTSVAGQTCRPAFVCPVAIMLC